MAITLILGARGLPNKDRFSKSDPFVVLFVVAEDGAPKFVKRTETIKVCLNYEQSFNKHNNNLLAFYVIIYD